MIYTKDNSVVVTKRVSRIDDNVPCWTLECIKKNLDKNNDKRFIIFQTSIDNQNLLVSYIRKQ
jgi:hypothetical protein